MSNAQHFYDLACGTGENSAEAMRLGHIFMTVSTLPADRMASDPLLHIASEDINNFAFYAGVLKAKFGVNAPVWPVTILWEIRIGGRNYVNDQPLLTRKTVLVNEADHRRGLAIAMQCPTFRQLMLSARLLTPVGVVPQTAIVDMQIDAEVVLSGGASDLHVRVGDVIG